jgi:hypothetical protein
MHPSFDSVGPGIWPLALCATVLDRCRSRRTSGVVVWLIAGWLGGFAIEPGPSSAEEVSGPGLAEPGGAIDQAAQQGPSDAKSPTEARVFFGPETGLRIEGEHAWIALHGHTWLRAEAQERVGGNTEVQGSIPVARVFTVGSVLDSRLHFFAQEEFGDGDPELLDLFAEWWFCDALHVRAGQFRTPYSRAFITPLTNLTLSTRGLVDQEFNLGRDTGAIASGTLGDGLYHYDLALVNGATIDDLEGNRNSPSVILRNELRFGEPVPYDQAPSLTIDDPRGVTLGFGGAFSRRAVEGAPGATTQSLWNAGADVAWMRGPVSVIAEGFWRGASGSPQTSNAFGAYAQAGVFVLPRLLELGGRAGWLSNGPDLQTYEAYLTAYWKSGSLALGHHLQMNLGFRYDSGDPSQSGPVDLRDRYLVRLQTQIFF